MIAVSLEMSDEPNFITQKMDGKIVLLLIYDKEDASTAKVSVLKEIIKEEGYPIE